MENLLDILRSQRAERPAMTVQDAAKLLYQSEFGGGHLIRDPAGALDWLRREMADCRDAASPLLEPIGGGAVRVNLGPAAGRVSPETLFRIFYLSSQKVHGKIDSFREKLKLLYALDFDRAEVDGFLGEYEAAGLPMLSHSEVYRAAYRPAYRVVSGEYARWFAAIAALDRLPGPVTVGIDGMAASGKSTLGAVLAEVFDGGLYHADDYFLPGSKRTAARLSEPGGNMDRERLREEVLVPLERGQAPVTRRFDCHTMTFEPPVEHPARRVNIVEGSYCLHPELRDYYALKIALRTSPETQTERIRERDPGKIEDYVNRWVPMEERYFRWSNLYDATDLVIDT